MDRITFLSDLYAPHVSMARSKRGVLRCLQLLCALNLDYLKEHPYTPDVYQSGLIYVPEFGTEEWVTIPRLLARGYGDCEDLASYQVAWYLLRGYPAKPAVITKQYTLHVVVLHPNGQIEDPSASLGMNLWQPLMRHMQEFSNREIS